METSPSLISQRALKAQQIKWSFLFVCLLFLFSGYRPKWVNLTEYNTADNLEHYFRLGGRPEVRVTVRADAIYSLKSCLKSDITFWKWQAQGLNEEWDLMHTHTRTLTHIFSKCGQQRNYIRSVPVYIFKWHLPTNQKHSASMVQLVLTAERFMMQLQSQINWTWLWHKNRVSVPDSRADRTPACRQWKGRWWFDRPRFST